MKLGALEAAKGSISEQIGSILENVLENGKRAMQKTSQASRPEAIPTCDIFWSGINHLACDHYIYIRSEVHLI